MNSAQPRSGHDVVAGHTVALSAEHGWRIITDEPTRLLALDANAEIDIVP
ncbi:hypothetical protein F4553_003973 [Allocatelliglobosispora scoriae]|uniref:Uncharacterized protein n=1 Tax=Allocatelliglobosispora scoriae TaxID=643052 RepID=A0A841BQS1_9ACTN|nr:hypothetical protein [Allocatelliglobosispora scoriae]MBB5870594.1 hypothetical protein [Allocatelliglobosispora scoriae]